MISENRNEKMGSGEYIERVLADYSDSILRLCYTYTHNIHDSEDIAQETFVALMQRREPFESREHEKAWLLAAAANKCRNHFKSGWFKNTVPLEDSPEPAEDFSPDEGSELAEAMKKLPEKYRLPIHLYYYEGYSVNEISKILNKKYATVGTLLDRGREQLRSILEGGGRNGA